MPRAVFQDAFENVYLQADGRIGGMAPGRRMAVHGHALPLVVPQPAGETIVIGSGVPE
jgi:hypothetical protein